MLPQIHQYNEKMYRSSRFDDEKRLFQEIKRTEFFHISAVRLRTGVCACVKGRYALFSSAVIENVQLFL